MTDWQQIDDLAARLGVKKPARMKWRQRGHVPYRWRLPLIEEAAKAGHPIKPADIPTQEPNGNGKAA